MRACNKSILQFQIKVKKNLNKTPPISWRGKDSSVGRIANEPTIFIKMRFVRVLAHPRYNLHRPVGETLGISSLRCSPARKMKKNSVGELPDEVGDTAISLQGLGEKALQCFLLFKNLNKTPPIFWKGEQMFYSFLVGIFKIPSLRKTRI